MAITKSIKELLPLDISGRHARKGFSYQDHVAVGLCISLLTNPNLKEIWLETHEDLLLFWEQNGLITVEFLQVKAVDQTSRWSVPLICGSGTPSESIVKKLLDQDRCTEKVLFRIVSSYDVNQELAVLKKTINSVERNAETSKEIELSDSIVKKLGDMRSPNGKTIADWVKLCWWEKKADNLEDLVSSNKIALENALASIGKSIFWDQRNEVYQKILRYCQEASTGDLTLNSNCYKIERESFLHWLNNAIELLYSPSAGAEKLEDKLLKAKNVPSDYVGTAKQLRWLYISQRLSNDFVQPSELSSLESVILGELYKMKVELDNDEIDEEAFHKICIDRLDEIKKSDAFKNKNIPEYLLTGYMYKLTGDCLHRFRKVEI